MLLLSAESYVYNILSLYIEGQGKKSSLNLVSFTGLVYRPPKSVCFFCKIYWEGSFEIIFRKK